MDSLYLFSLEIINKLAAMLIFALKGFKLINTSDIKLKAKVRKTISIQHHAHNPFHLLTSTFENIAKVDQYSRY